MLWPRRRRSLDDNAHKAREVHKMIRSVLCTLAAILLVACISGDAAGEKKTVRLAYAQWSCATAASNVVKAVLEEKMGYRCQLIPMGAEALWLSTASRHTDAFVCAWLPSLHQHFYAKAGYNVRDLGPNLKGTQVGLVVPEYVSIDSMAQIQEQAPQFNNRIIGIDPSAGIMRLTHKAIKAYNLQDVELIAGSGPSMTRILEEKISNQEWVVVTGWTPHWKFARWDLKYLHDPKDVFGGSESIHTVVRTGLRSEFPRVYQFLDSFSWSLEDIQLVMEMIHTSDAPYASAVSWVHQHPQQVESWIAD